MRLERPNDLAQVVGRVPARDLNCARSRRLQLPVDTSSQAAPGKLSGGRCATFRLEFSVRKIRVESCSSEQRATWARLARGAAVRQRVRVHVRDPAPRALGLPARCSRNLVSYSKGFYRHSQKQLKSVLCLENTLISYLNSCKKAHEKAEKGFEIGDFSVQSLKS